MTYPDTYYARTRADRAERSPLAGSLQCDTVIIGGGLAGLTTALELARGGQSVVLLEKQSVGFGASGRNGGFVSPGYSTGGDEIAKRAGPQTAAALHRLSIEGMDHVRQTIDALKIEGTAPQAGIMSVLRHDDGASLKAHAEKMQRDYGYALEFIDTPDLRERLRSRRYFQALRDPRAFHLHPLNYLRGIARETERLGGRIFEGSEVTSCTFTAVAKSVSTATGTVSARNVVFATGGYTGTLDVRLKRSFLPIATYVMLTEEAPELIASVIATRDAIGDNRRAGDYYRLVEGGKRILWGGRITTRAASPHALAAELRREMVGTYPELAALRTEIAWSGLMAYARHLMPQIGQRQPGVWHCTAFGGHGLNTTAIGGKVVAEAILGQSDRYRLFEPFGLVWAGGLAGLATAQLTYWKLQVQDWWRERAA